MYIHEGTCEHGAEHARVSEALCAPVGTLRAVGGAVRVPVKALRVCVSGGLIGYVSLHDPVLLRLFPTPLRVSHPGPCYRELVVVWGVGVSL